MRDKAYKAMQETKENSPYLNSIVLHVSLATEACEDGGRPEREKLPPCVESACDLENSWIC